MITPKEAFEKIMQYDVPFHIKEVSIHQAQGKILAENIVADRDFPPFDRVCMDGIAIQYTDYKNTSFKSLGIQSAGEKAQVLISPHHCIEIMTGAMLPTNADTIIPYEHLQKVEQGKDIFFTAIQPIRQGQNIHPQGIDRKQGALLLSKNTFIRSVEIGILASVGKTTIKVFEYPQILVVSTGNELVDIDQIPLPYQIRKSNVYAIASLLQSMGILVSIAHLDDDRQKIQSFIADHKSKYGVMILSGGISAGKFDFLPEVLKAEGLKTIFHKVAQKPGKPMLFGVFDAQRIVFSLPGNPVSTLVCMYRYVLPWLKRNTTPQSIVLAKDIEIKNELTHFIPVYIQDNLAYPISTNGSGDFIALAQAQGMVAITPPKKKVLQGEQLPYWAFV